jgi:hypothetical protein
MINVLKKYWLLSFIILITINFLGFYLFKNSPDFLDLVEHAESDDMIQNIKREELQYEIFFSVLLILDVWIILFIPYLIVRNIIKKLKLSKK